MALGIRAILAGARGRLLRPHPLGRDERRPKARLLSLALRFARLLFGEGVDRLRHRFQSLARNLLAALVGQPIGSSAIFFSARPRVRGARRHERRDFPPARACPAAAHRPRIPASRWRRSRLSRLPRQPHHRSPRPVARANLAQTQSLFFDESRVEVGCIGHRNCSS